MQGRDVKFSISTLLPCLILFIIPPYVSMFFFENFYWSIVDLQRCASFRCTTKWISYTNTYAAAAAKSLQSCLTLCDPIDGSPPGSPVPGILQARTLEWVAISFSNAWKWKVKRKSPSRVRLFATPWTAAYQVPPFMGFSRQEYWSGVPLPSPSVSAKQLKNIVVCIFWWGSCPKAALDCFSLVSIP